VPDRITGTIDGNASAIENNIARSSQVHLSIDLPIQGA
jgi:hypothetical protein